MPRPNDPNLADALADTLGLAASPTPASRVAGGCISDSECWSTAEGPVFVKRTALDRRWILDAEQDGLERLAATGTVRVPAVLGSGVAGSAAFLALEWLDLERADEAAESRLGRALAELHACVAPAYGLDRDNAIGETPQSNAPDGDWPRFWRERRLAPQLERAARSGHGGRLQSRGGRLLDCVAALLDGHAPEPSLLHGDLWGGNHAMLPDGTPVVFDPAVYHGDAEADLAMTELFGGFGPAFRRAYSAERPAAPGSDVRRELYNLYHVLNHLNLFGGAYRAQAEAMIDRLLAAAGH